VEVGVADPARLDLHQRLTWPGVGDVDRLDADRLAQRAGDDCLDLVHAVLSLERRFSGGAGIL
jgi:hypothetical protein